VTYLEIGLLLIGLGVLVFGYRKNSRNVLVVAALVLLASVAIPDFVAGFQDGVAGVAHHATSG
jgi:hypothetical protein